jgi:molybdopterin-guanine dinucleotide biosynthesis protein A
MLVTTNQPDDYAFLGLRCVPDLLPGRGALGGLYTALSVASHPLVMVAACDMPFASPALFAHARDLLLETGADAVVPSVEKGPEPLHAVYRRATCLPPVLAALEAGERRLISWFDHVDVHLLSPAETARFAPSGLAFWNLNTPEEFQQAEELARREKPISP